MIETIIDSSITRKLYSIYDLDIDGMVRNTKAVKTLNFEYPRVEILELIFMKFLENISSQYFYMTDGTEIKENEIYLKFSKNSFIEFIKTHKTFVSPKGYKYKIDDYYMIGLTIFDESFEWLIHNNMDVGNTTFSYQYEKFNNLEMLIQNEWYMKSNL